MSAPPIDGLGSIVTISNPTAGQGWTMTVPAGFRWRPWGGSCHYQSSAVAGSRFPILTYQTPSGGVLWMESQNHAPQANSSYTIAYYEGECFLSDLYINLYLPIALKAIWLPAGTLIVGSFESMDPGDQVTNVGLLVEQLPA